MSAIEKVQRELDDLEFKTEVVTDSACSQPPVIMFDYSVNNGKHRGRKFRVGISFQEDAYPEYPPHFVHIASPPATRFTKYDSYTYQGLNWLVFSIPPSDFWDSLAPECKNMKQYVYRHLPRVWAQL